MARTIKAPEVRRNDLLTAAGRLFREKGWENTAVSDIVAAAGMAQGTFYLTFRSKEDLLVALLDEARRAVLGPLEETAARTDLGAAAKLNELARLEFLLQRREDPLYDILHRPGHEGLHQRVLTGTIGNLVPLYEAVIRQGVAEGIFSTPYPRETAEYLLTAVKFLFDPGVFAQDPKRLADRLAAASLIGERALGAPPGTLQGPPAAEPTLPGASQ